MEFPAKPIAPVDPHGPDPSPLVAPRQAPMEQRQLEQLQMPTREITAPKKMTPQMLGQRLKTKAAHMRSNQIRSSLHSLIKIQIHNLKIHPPTQSFHYPIFQTRK